MIPLSLQERAFLLSALLLFCLGTGIYLVRGRPMLFGTILCLAGCLWLLLWVLVKWPLFHTLELVFLLMALVVFFVLEGLVIANHNSRIQGEPQVLIVLGATARESGPSPVLQARLDAALAYWQEHPQVILILSGGQGADEPETEAQCMYRYLTEHGVPAQQLLMEESATNTLENLSCSVALLRELGYSTEQLLVVSNGFHLCRVKLLAQRLGLDISTLSAPATSWPSRLYYYARETMALVKSWALDH